MSRARPKKGRGGRTAARPDIKSRILKLLDSKVRRPVTLQDMSAALNVPREERRVLARAVRTLAETGDLIRITGGRYARPAKVHLLTGSVKVVWDGRGVVTAEEGGEPVSVAAAFLSGAMDGDRVVVRVEGRGPRGVPEGRVIRVLRRAHSRVSAVLEGAADVWVARPYNSRLTGDILIPVSRTGGAKSGELVLVRFTEYPEEGRSARGEVVEVLGRPLDLSAETRAVVARMELPDRFGSAALAEAKALSGAVPRGAARGRRDLRNLPFVTIDGPNARDFDDALCAVEDDGVVSLLVAIADVSHFVKAGSALDSEARLRGNSVYFPETVLPMLPERLSNDLCSLRPGEDRLAMVCAINLGRDGNRKSDEIYPAVIRSAARLTYGQAEQFLTTGREKAVQAKEAVGRNLKALRRIADLLAARRRERGSIDFDFPEPEMVLDCTGQVENILRAERFGTHRLVEECMLLANETVASRLRRAGAAAVYRVHEPPDPERIRDLNSLLQILGRAIPLSAAGSPGAFRSVLEAARGTPRERFLNTAVLRSMMRARYAPAPLGHFALALKDYCHFTSPIRRYADLAVHRAVKGVLGLAPPPQAEGLEALCAQISRSEQSADEAERDILAFLRALYLADKVGERHAGIVSGIAPFGFFVELREVFAEGLVRLSSLGDDFYRYREESLSLIGENTGRTFRIGDPVEVEVSRVDPARRHVDFVLCSPSPAHARARRPA